MEAVGVELFYCLNPHHLPLHQLPQPVENDVVHPDKPEVLASIDAVPNPAFENLD